MLNRSWVIRHAALGKYSPDCIALETHDLENPGPGELLLRNVYISLDPTSRNWLKLEPFNNYLDLEVGGVVRGPVISRVEASRAEGFAEGDWVTGMFGWEDRSIRPADQVRKIFVGPGVPAAAHLTIFSHIGRAAAMGLLAVGRLRPQDTVLVSAAAGATGSLAAQIAKAQGCRTIGIAGGAAKQRFLLQDLGLDGAIDYKSEDPGEALVRLCPNGVDLFFDNVGGATLDAVLLHLARRARVVICGAVSQYDLDLGEAPYGVKNLPRLVFASASLEGFVVPQFADRYVEFDDLLRRLLIEGKIGHRAHIVRGLEVVAEAVSLMLTGANQGKLMVQLVADDEIED